MASTMNETPLVRIEDRDMFQVVFSANGEYLVSGGEQVFVWRVKDGTRIARMNTVQTVLDLAVSNDNRWIAAGTRRGRVFVWSANTFEQVFMHEGGEDDVNGIDFSPDSTRLVTASDNRTAVVFDVATRQRVLGPLEHETWLRAAKYSPQGDRFATATGDAIRVWDSNNGQLLVEVPEGVPPFYNTSLVWSANDQFMILSQGKIKRVDASTGSIISQWPVPDAISTQLAIIVMPHHKEFLAYTAGGTVAFLDVSTHTQFGHIQHTEYIRSIAISSDDRLVATLESDTKINIHQLSRIVVPFIDIPEAVLDAWEQDRLVEAETLLTRAIAGSEKPSCHALANRALVHAHLGHWNAAIEDVEKSISIQPSVIGYIAKSVTLIGRESKEEISRVYDLAFRHIQLFDVDGLLLIKAVILFMAGEHEYAMSRVNDLVATVSSNSLCYEVQAYMYLLRGNSHMDDNNYEGAIQSYERARAHIRNSVGPYLRTIALVSGWRFDSLGITIEQRLCDALYAAGRTKEASESLLKMVNSFDEAVFVHRAIPKWLSDFTHQYISTPEEKCVLDFKQQCAEKLMRVGDAAADAKQHDNAIIHYSVSLALHPAVPLDIFVQRSKARALVGLWEDALNDANEVIMLEPSSPWGYERKYVALGVAGHHKDMSDAFETMFSKMAQSHDPEICERRHQYPKTQQTIRGAIQAVIRELPRILINTSSGRLCDKSEQAIAFELSPGFAELTSSMTTQMDLIRIEREVTQYYRYATFSHKLEDNEPLFEEVINGVVYDLEKSPTHDKLQTFCKIVRDAGFHWAWSSTCCIDNADHTVVQEALVSMFRWYQESTMTIILLSDVDFQSQNGDLLKSIWNSRVWLFQEYHASKVVRFYNKDWTPYRNLDIPNHKESPEIILEIEEASGISAEALMALRPGLGNIREKLRLASNRETTLVEDAAYSQFGMFSVSLPVVYGEGDKALGHLLSHLLTSSRDTSILSWIGKSGSFNSCLPADTTVFDELSTSHIQPAAEGPEVDEIIASLRASSSSLAFLTKLNNRLNELPAPWFAGQELKLPCIAVKLGPVSATHTSSERVFHVQTATFGAVEIKTDEDLSQFDSLYLVHSWIDFLLDRPPVGSTRETSREENTEDEPSVHGLLSFPGSSKTLQKRAARLVAHLKQFRGRHAPHHEDTSSDELPSSSLQVDRQMQAVRFAARLRKPFDALLLAPDAGNPAAYRRVAAESRITVQVKDITAPILKQLVDGVRVLDVL